MKTDFSVDDLSLTEKLLIIGFCLVAGTLISVLTSHAQTLPASGLIVKYDMLTTSAGPVLTDLSGAGNNSLTITGTTTNAQGRVFNGTSDWINMPHLIGNSNFTVCWVSAEANTGNALWSESAAGASQFIRVATAANGDTLAGSLTSTSLPSQAVGGRFTDASPDWDGFCITRSDNAFYGIKLGRPNALASAAPVNIGTITTTAAGIGALNEGGTQIQFWGGTLAYFVLYNRPLTLPEQGAVYNFMAAQVLPRPVFLHPLVSDFAPKSNAPVWQRQGVFWQNASGNVSTPSALYDTVNCPTLGVTPCVRVWATYAGTNVIEIESADGVTGAKAYGGNTSPTTVLSGYFAPTVLKVGSTYHMYAGEGTPSDFQVNHYTSSDGITWTLSAAAVISLGSAGTVDAQHIQNPSVLYNPDGTGNWYMLYGCYGTWSGTWGSVGPGAGTGWRTCGATSSDPNGNTWTKLTANPPLGTATVDAPSWMNSTFCCGNPDLHYINNSWYEWDGSQLGLFRFASHTFNDLWVYSQAHPSFLNNAPDEAGQLGDVSILDAYATPLGKTFVYQEGFYPAGSNGVLKVSTAALPLTSIITTSEGMTTDWP